MVLKVGSRPEGYTKMRILSVSIPICFLHKKSLFACLFESNVQPTTKVIWRRGYSLKSLPTGEDKDKTRDPCFTRQFIKHLVLLNLLNSSQKSDKVLESFHFITFPQLQSVHRHRTSKIFMVSKMSILILQGLYYMLLT